MDVTCPKCGAENYDSARYCRKCGEQIGDTDFHEAQTRELGHERAAAPAPEPRRYETYPSAPLNQSGQSGSPRYVPPPAHPAPLASAGATGLPSRIDTSPINTGPVAKKTNWLLIIGGIFMAFILGIGVIAAIVANVAKKAIQEASKNGPIAAGPAGPAVPTGKVIKNPKLSQLPAEVRAWYYEGAKTRDYIGGGYGNLSGSVFTMDTDDDPSTVAEFYREKFGGEGTEINSQDNKIVFANERGTVVTIEPNRGPDDETGITVILGSGPGMGGPAGTPEIPPVPGTPVPPVPPPPAPPAPVTPTPKK
jgi:hypothetical protein